MISPINQPTFTGSTRNVENSNEDSKSDGCTCGSWGFVETVTEVKSNVHHGFGSLFSAGACFCLEEGR